MAAPGDPSRVVGGVLPDGLGEQPEGGVAAAEGGGVLGDPAEGAAKRQQPDPAVGAGGLGEQGPDLVDRFGGKGLQQQALPVVALAPAVVVVALGLEVEVGPGAEGVERRSKGAQRGQVALGAGQRAAVVALTTTTGRPATCGGNGGPGGATNQPMPAVTSSGAAAMAAVKAAATSRARSIG